MAEILIRKPTSKKIPRYWLFLDWNLKAFVCRFAEFNGSGWQPILQHSASNSSFFTFLSQLKTHKNSPIHCVAWRIYEFLCSCDIYQAIHNNALSITEARAIPGKNVPQSLLRKLKGGLVCENPPTIIDADTFSGQKVKFLDIANWGIDRGDIEDGECTFDCDVPQQAIEDYITMVCTLGMGQLKQTAASQGYYCFRMSHMQDRIYADTDERARRIERFSYVGGRAECFRLGRIRGQVFHVDVKGMYSSIGKLCNFPTRLIDIRFSSSVNNSRKIASRDGAIAHVEITTSYPCYPLRIDNRVIYPVGTFDTFLAGPELVKAFATDSINRVHVLCRYEMAPIFSSFSDWYFASLSQLDNLGIGHMKRCLKLCVNSTYGKIGQRSKRWIDLEDQMPRYPYEQWWSRHPTERTITQFRSVDSVVQYMDAEQEAPTSCPAISSYMCSYGRMKLWDIMLTANLHNCYYCDTDGVMVSKEGYDNLCNAGYVQEGVAGRLSLRESSSDVEIFGIKHYRFGDRWCCSGIPDGHIYRHNGKVEFEQHAPFGDGLWHCKAFEHEYRMIERSYKRKYKHGIRNDNGTVSTFTVGLEEVSRKEKDAREYTERVPRILGATDIFAR